MLNKKYIWSFMGQVKGKPTRENMLAKLKNIPGEKFVHITEEWNDKNQIKISEYKQILEDSVFVPCPSGWGGAIGLKDCFRLYETLEAGSIPIVEKDDYKYFDSFFPGHPLIQVSTDWNEIEDVINDLLKDEDELKAYNEKLIKWWSDYKITLKAKIKEITKPNLQKNKLAIISSGAQKLKTCSINIPRNCPIKQKWKLALAALSRNENVLLVSSNLLKVSNKQSIKDYIEEDIDIITSQHNYEEWGVKLNTKITSSFIYIKSSIKSIKLIDNLITQLTNIKEDKRFYSYKEHFSDCVLENNINNSNLKVKLIPNTEFCVSEEIYGKNIKHYKSNPPAYINFDRNVYTEELKKVYFDYSITHEAFPYLKKSSEEIVKEFNVKCQLTQNQLIHIINEIKSRECNCNILVFGLGHDSIIYDTINDGYTLFIEEDQEWISLNKNITNVLHFNYPTKVKDSIPININKLESYSMPNEIANINWDIILIDAPAGWSLSKSGRSLPIYWSSKLAKKKTVIFVDDQKRELELKYSKYFLNSNKFNSTIYSERDGFGVYKLKCKS